MNSKTLLYGRGRIELLLVHGFMNGGLQLKRGLNRLFAVLTPLWMVYCLLVYPMQRRVQAEKVERTEFTSCWQRTPDFKGCADWARVKAGADLWTLRAFYTRESWLLAMSHC